jgi:hypothetical protein
MNASLGTYPGSGPFGGQPAYTPTDDEWPVYRDTRVASGEPLTSDIMKCRLKPLSRLDYSVTFTEEQWARLQAVYPAGVCDYSVPGVGQVAPKPWQSFADGPGGRPLGRAPESRPVEGGHHDHHDGDHRHRNRR